MALSGAINRYVLLFVLLQEFLTGDTLAHFWKALSMLQAMRGLASAVKILDKEGPIKLLKSTQQQYSLGQCHCNPEASTMDRKRLTNLPNNAKVSLLN